MGTRMGGAQAMGTAIKLAGLQLKENSAQQGQLPLELVVFSLFIYLVLSMCVCLLYVH